MRPAIPAFPTTSTSTAWSSDERTIAIAGSSSITTWANPRAPASCVVYTCSSSAALCARVASAAPCSVSAACCGTITCTTWSSAPNRSANEAAHSTALAAVSERSVPTITRWTGPTASVLADAMRASWRLGSSAANGENPRTEGDATTHTGRDQGRWYPASSAGVAQWQSNRLVSGRSWVRIPSPAQAPVADEEVAGRTSCRRSEQVARIAADEGTSRDPACCRSRDGAPGGRRPRPSVGRPLGHPRAEHRGLDPRDGDPVRRDRSPRHPVAGGGLCAVRPTLLHGRVDVAGGSRRSGAARRGAPASDRGHQGRRPHGGGAPAVATAGGRRGRPRDGDSCRSRDRPGSRRARARQPRPGAEAPSTEAPQAAPASEGAPAEADAATEAPAAETPAPAPAPAAAPAERPEVSLDQEVFDQTLKELLDKGTDKRVAEGQARRAAMIAARKKAAGEA